LPKSVACNVLTTWVVLCKSSTRLAYVVVGKLCAWFTQYNSSCTCKQERIQTCQVLKNFMREGNFLRLVSTRRHHSWRVWVHQIARKLPFRGFSSALFEAQTLCVHAINWIWNFIRRSSFPNGKNSAPQASPSFLSLFDMRLRRTFSRLLKTSGYWRWQKECIGHCANEEKWE
jgi:hypothetical protein